MARAASEKKISISNRQFVIMALLLEGLSVKEIANRLGVSSHTAQSHLKRIYQAFDVHSRFELQAVFIRQVREMAAGVRSAATVAGFTDQSHHLTLP
jgi:DNA-binding CsgD family transcriptional regulator